MKIDLGYTYTNQSSADIEIDDKHYLAWCREQYLHTDTHPKGKSDEELLKDEETIVEYLNYDPQFLSELIGWGETDTIAFDIDINE